MGNKFVTKLIQTFHPTSVFSLHVDLTELKMGVLQHNFTLDLGIGQTKDLLIRMGWNLREEAKLLLPFDECHTPNHLFIMNIIVWCVFTIQQFWL